MILVIGKSIADKDCFVKGKSAFLQRKTRAHVIKKRRAGDGAPYGTVHFCVILNEVKDLSSALSKGFFADAQNDRGGA